MRRTALLASALLSVILITEHAVFAQGGPGASGASSAAPSSSPSSAPPVSGQGQYSGSVPSALEPGTLQLSLQDAINRGLKQNLGLLLSGGDVGVARGQRWQQLSALLPDVTASPYADASQVSLAEFGFSFKFPGVNIPSVVGPFYYVDARANVTQSIFDLKAINNSRAASASVKQAQYTYEDARDLVVLSVGYAYLQAVADQARIDTAQAQVNTAQALFDQASDQVTAGTSPAIDALRAHVELQTRQQQLIQSRNDFAIQKLALARAIGLAPAQAYELTDQDLYQVTQPPSVDETLKRAYASRSDYKAAESEVKSSDYAKKAAEAEYLPSLSFSGDYGLASTVPSFSSHGVFDVRGTLQIPIFQGGRTHGDVLEATARLEQSQQRLDNLRGQIDSDVRTALLDLESAEELVTVAKSNIDLAEQAFAQSRDRFQAGVTDTVEVVQAQEAVASAHEQYISSLYSDNYAKVSLARAIGGAETVFKEFFKGK